MFCTNTYRCSYRAWHQSVSPDTSYSYYSYSIINGVAIAKSNIQWNCWDAVFTGAQSLALQAWALLVPQQCCKCSAVEFGRVKEQGRWSTLSWSSATVLCWAFLHLQKLPWYFNNCGWFNGPPGKQQHWYSWVHATNIIGYNFLVRQLSFKNQGGIFFCFYTSIVTHFGRSVILCTFSWLKYTVSPVWNILHLQQGTNTGVQKKKKKVHFCRTHPYLSL